MTEMSWEQARQLVLQRLRVWRDSLPPAERSLPFLVWKDRYLSPNDMIREVELNSQIGAEIVSAELRKLGYLVG